MPVWVSSSSVLTFVHFPTIFGLAILLVAILAIADDFPSVENPTLSRFVDHDVEDEDDGAAAK